MDPFHLKSHLRIPKTSIILQGTLYLLLVKLSEIEGNDKVKVYDEHVTVAKVSTKCVKDIDKAETDL